MTPLIDVMLVPAGDLHDRRVVDDVQPKMELLKAHQAKNTDSGADARAR